MLARLWQRKRSDEGRYSSIMGSAIFTKNFKLIFCVFPPSLCLIVSRALVQYHYIVHYLHIFLNLRISEHSAPQKESGKLEGKVSKCRFCCLLQISAPHLVFFWAPCIGGQTNYGGAISGHTFPTSRLSGLTPSPSSAPIAFLELVKDEEWPQ